MQGIVIQGPTKYYKEMVDHYKDIPNIVWSTWDDEPYENIKYISENMKCILNTYPECPGHLNVNLQAKTTYTGVEYLIEKGVTEILKIRGDVKITNVEKLLEILKGRKISFLQMCKPGVRKINYNFIYNHFSHDYPADVIVYGASDVMAGGFGFYIDKMVPIPPESIIAHSILRYLGVEFYLEYKHLIQNGITFFLQECLDNGINVMWLKNGLSISEGTKDKNEYEY
jgi:hypothetical protein